MEAQGPEASRPPLSVGGALPVSRMTGRHYPQTLTNAATTSSLHRSTATLSN
jgi:hypothetical protein